MQRSYEYQAHVPTGLISGSVAVSDDDVRVFIDRIEMVKARWDAPGRHRSERVDIFVPRKRSDGMAVYFHLKPDETDWIETLMNERFEELDRTSDTPEDDLAAEMQERGFEEHDICCMYVLPNAVPSGWNMWDQILEEVV